MTAISSGNAIVNSLNSAAAATQAGSTQSASNSQSSSSASGFGPAYVLSLSPQGATAAGANDNSTNSTSSSPTSSSTASGGAGGGGGTNAAVSGALVSAADAVQEAIQKLEAQGIDPVDAGFLVDQQGNVDQVKLAQLLAAQQQQQ